MPAPPLDVASLDRLMSYSWPGNVRELVNLVERVLILDLMDRSISPNIFRKILPGTCTPKKETTISKI